MKYEDFSKIENQNGLRGIQAKKLGYNPNYYPETILLDGIPFRYLSENRYEDGTLVSVLYVDERDRYLEVYF